MQIKIMTYNIHRGEGMDSKTDIRRIAEEIRKSGAAVAALQEVDRFQLRSGWKDQLRLLADELGMFTSFAASVNFGVVQFGNAILSKYPIISKDIVYLWGIRERRTILTVKVDTDKGPLHIVGLHLGVTEKERARQMPRVVGRLEAVGAPAVLLGDFNMASSHPLMEPLQAKWKKVPLDGKKATFVHGGEIDHIYTNIARLTAKAWVQPSAASDHYPVVAELAWD